MTAGLKRRERPIIVGIVGDSGAGKSTFAAGLAEALGRDRTLCICIDDYHRYSREERAHIGVTPHDPACNYLDILEQHVALLRNAEPVLKPVYNHIGGIREAPEYVIPKQFIILEGLHGYATSRLREYHDLKLYLEPQESLRLRWKFQRDTGPGGFGYTVEQAMALLPKLNRDSALYVAPHREFADMVVSFLPPEHKPEESGAALNARHLLRPTLPYVDLAPLLDACAEGGLILELARDLDGRPADALHVMSGIPAEPAVALRERMWDLLPEHSLVNRHPRPQIGFYKDAEGNIQFSHTLAVSQLLVTHYLLNATVTADAN